MRRILLPLLLMAIPAFSQAAYYQNNAFTANYIGGAHVVTVLDGSTVEICTSVTGACSKVAIYADQALTVPLANPMPIDAGGNFGFWVAPGSYSYWILDVNGSALAQTPFTTGGGSGSGSGITGLTGDGTATGPGVVSLTLATVNSSPGACGDATHVCVVTTDGKGRVTAQTPVAISAGSTGVASLNSLTGALNITAGSNIAVTPSGSSIQIASTVPAALSGQTAGYLPKANTATTSIGPSIISDDGTTATVHGALAASNITDSALGAGNCVQTAAGGLLISAGAPCGSGSGGGGSPGLSGSTALPTTSVAANSCDASATTTTATGAASTSAIAASFNADPNTVTGYGVAGLYVSVWPTANTINFKRCNNTASPITPAAATINWSVPGVSNGPTIATITSGTCSFGSATSAIAYNENATVGTAVTCTLPAPVAGNQFCVSNFNNGTAATTGTLELLVANTGTDSIVYNGAKSASGFIQSSGAAGDMACVTAVSSTQWAATTQNGVWTLH